MGSSLSMVLPQDVRRDGERLFDVAMWCLGRDIGREDNLLLRLGFTRERKPEGQPGTSAYSGVLPEGGAFTLWGFGVLCHVCGEAIYVPREGFTPRLVDAARLVAPVFQAEGLGPLRPPATASECEAARLAVVALARGLAGYEAWVQEAVGLEWRHTCLAARRKASPVPAEALPVAWRRLAARIASLETVLN
jgi:hypothetical protein